MAIIIALFLFMLSSPAFSYSEKTDVQEYEVKAAYLFNFARLTEWPGSAFSSSNNNFSICVLGEDPFEGGLNALRGRSIYGRNVLIRRIQEVSESSGCNLLFIASSETDHLPEIMSSLRNKPVLTVSDIKGFDNVGGIIAMFLKDNRVKFRVNMDAARKANLKISSYLLEAAETVKRERERERERVDDDK